MTQTNKKETVTLKTGVKVERRPNRLRDSIHVRVVEMAELEGSAIRYHEACFNPLQALYEVAEMTHLTRCDKCNVIMVSENPTIGARKHIVSGRELHMEYVRIGYNDYVWACPVCESNENLKEL